jgi:hypothetical protein
MAVTPLPLRGMPQEILLKQIDHDPNENVKLPDYGDRAWAKKKFGENPQPADLIYYLIPIAAVSIALYLIRGY